MASSDRPILGFDTSAAHCAAVLLSGDRILAQRTEEMTRGQAERLLPLIEDVLAEAGVAWDEVGRLGVGTGPGNFTGLRIAVAAARGLALALDIPAIGVSSFDAITPEAGARAAIPAPRDQVYLRDAAGEITLHPRDEAEAAGPLTFPPEPGTLAAAIARAAARAEPPFTVPAPLYVRPADAAPARDVPPRILDDA